MYYELEEEKSNLAEGKDIAICRIEQLCPFPYDLVQKELKRYPSKIMLSLNNTKNIPYPTFSLLDGMFQSLFWMCCACINIMSDAEVVWCQEEPMNMGGYSYIAPWLSSTT